MRNSDEWWSIEESSEEVCSIGDGWGQVVDPAEIEAYNQDPENFAQIPMDLELSRSGIYLDALADLSNDEHDVQKENEEALLAQWERLRLHDEIVNDVYRPGRRDADANNHGTKRSLADERLNKRGNPMDELPRVDNIHGMFNRRILVARRKTTRADLLRSGVFKFGPDTNEPDNGDYSIPDNNKFRF